MRATTDLTSARGCALRFQSEEFALPTYARALIDPTTAYRAYFTPFTKVLLAIEELPTPGASGAGGAATATNASDVHGPIARPPSDRGRALLNAIRTAERPLYCNRQGLVGPGQAAPRLVEY